MCEIFNEGDNYILNLENKADEKILYRTNLKVKSGYNRFLIPTSDFNFLSEYRNYLYLYPNKNEPQLINFISLELITFKPEFLSKYISESDKKVKYVIWDLDNTLWDGVLGDNGVDNIYLRKDIVKIIQKLDGRGIINSISSKNYSEKAIEALERFGILDYFVCPMINWGPKSDSIKSIARTLDIGMDTFVFFDDSEFELGEVKQNCPEVRVCNVSRVKEYIKHDCFDVPVTAEGKKRRQSYKEIALRNQDALLFHSDEIDFLKQCKMVVQVAHPVKDEIERCYELVQRTNQLNISGERLSLDQVKKMLDLTQYDCYRIKVRDKYGDYGLVGFAIFDISDSHRVVLRHFVFLCRAARKKIEQTFFAEMIKKYRDMRYEELEIICKITEKNQLMRQVLEESGLFYKNTLLNDSYSLCVQLRNQDNMESEAIMEMILE